VSSDATRWGVWLHAVRPASELAELAAAAESLGAAAILVADEGTDRDLFVALTALAQRTRRVQLFGAVTNPHSRHPVATAAAFASVAELAPGRLVAGFGAGGSRVFGPMGIAPRRPFTALAECLHVVQALWRGERVEHEGEFSVRDAALPWSPGSLPIAIAGRGPRVERLAAERADWMLLAGRPIHSVAELVARLRGMGMATRGRPPAIAWNPNAAWTEPMQREMRAHLEYMKMDMPAEDRAALARQPEMLLERYAVAGERREVVARLAKLVRQVRPELLLFDADDYSVGFLESAASVAMDVGAVPVHNEEAAYGLDSHRRA
jgi:alkanesulfonate monooxygenase SsuD/methylene tetrahydromethanopterin reductase-like flavin-dependent oxidoreductase (luciferase family)